MAIPDVLIVDDDADVRRTLVLLLGKDYSVAEAPDGKEALRLIQEGRPRLILLDYSMPGMTGLEVLEAARTQDPTLKIMMLTSQTEIGYAKKALELGALAYVTKPFEVDFILGEVARLLAPADGPKDDGRPWKVKDDAS